LVKEPMAPGAAEGSKLSKTRRLPHNLDLIEYLINEVDSYAVIVFYLPIEVYILYSIHLF
jgi:hypothetical protein